MSALTAHHHKGKDKELDFKDEAREKREADYVLLMAGSAYWNKGMKKGWKEDAAIDKKIRTRHVLMSKPCLSVNKALDATTYFIISLLRILNSTRGKLILLVLFVL